MRVYQALHFARARYVTPLVRYQILSDPDKRRIYDQRGEAGLSESGGMGGMDPQVCLSAENVWFNIPKCFT